MYFLAESNFFLSSLFCKLIFFKFALYFSVTLFLLLFSEYCLKTFQADSSLPNELSIFVESVSESYAKDMNKRKSADFTSTDIKCSQVQKGS